MKRLIFLLTIIFITSSASAQTGWVRMPDGPWGKPNGIFFFSGDTGFVEERGKYGGRILYFTFDGGFSWREDRRLNSYSEEPCTQSSNKIINYTIILSSDFSDRRAIFGGGYYYDVCGSRSGHKSISWKWSPITDTWSSGGDADGLIDRFEIVDQAIIAVPGRVREYENSRSVLISPDDGSTWTRVDLSGNIWYSSKTSRFQSKDTGFVITEHVDIQQHWTAHRTVDGGKNWLVVKESLNDSTSLSSFSLVYGNDGLWYANSNHGLLSSSNVGLTWKFATTTPRKLPVEPDDSFYSYHQGYRTRHLDSASTALQLTEDSGKTWLDQIVVQEILSEISAPNSMIAYAVGPNGLLYKTTDGGGRFASVAAIEEKSSKLKAWSSGEEIIVENASDEIRVFDLLGRVVRTSRGEKLDGFAPGVYFVVSGEESVRVLVAP